MGDLKLISEYSDSAMLWSPEEALKDVLEEIKEDPSAIDGILVIKLRRKSGSFEVCRAVSKMRSSEIIAACEIVKQRSIDALSE